MSESIDLDEISKQFAEGIADLDLKNIGTQKTSPDAVLEITKKHKRRGRGGRKKFVDPKKQREFMSEEEKEILNYLDDFMSGENTRDMVRARANLRASALRAVKESDTEDKKEKALQLIINELEKNLKNKRIKSKNKAIYSAILEAINLKREVPSKEDNLSVEEKGGEPDSKEEVEKIEVDEIKEDELDKEPSDDDWEQIKLEEEVSQENVDTIEKLMEIVNRYGGVQGSQKFFTPEMVLDTIGKYRNDRSKENWMTRIIRSKVVEIIEKEDASAFEKAVEKLKNAGAGEEEINYIFNLKKEDRDDFMMSDDDELKIRIEKLREQKTKEVQERKDVLANERIIPLADELKKAREEYVKMEDDINIKISKLKNFFKNFINVDQSYQIEEELVAYKSRYEEALKKYTDAIVDMEGIDDAEEREIMLRYAEFGEKLQLKISREDLRAEKNPLMAKFKEVFKSGGDKFLDKYAQILSKPREWITGKTDSKILGLGGGMITVGGAMSFAANFVPGLNVATRGLGIALATKGFSQRAEKKAEMEKEKIFEAKVEELERMVANIDGANSNLDEVLKNELGINMQDIPESDRKDMEDYFRRIGLSFVKAIAVSAVAYEAGHYLRESGILQNGIEAAKKYFGAVSLVPVGEVSAPQENPEIPESKSGSEIKNPQVEINEAPQGPVVPAPAEVNEPAPSESNLDATAIEEGKADAENLPQNEAVSDNVSENVNEANQESMESRDAFRGMIMNGLNTGELAVIEGKGIKDSLAQFLIDNFEKFGEGGMGWDSEKFETVEEWADKRAIGIVGELKEQYPDYNFDKVSVGTKFALDLNDRADIKITGLNDPYNLGGNPDLITDLKENISAENQEVQAPEVKPVSPSENPNSQENIAKTENFEKSVTEEMRKAQEASPQFDVAKSIEQIRSEYKGESLINLEATQREMELAQKLGFTPEEYSELNNISVNELSKLKDSPNSESSNVQLKRIFNYLENEKENFVLDRNQSIGEIIRSLDGDTIAKILDSNDNVLTENFEPKTENLNMEEFYNNFIITELPELMRDKTILGEVFRELNSIGKESIGSQPKGEVFDLFKQTVNKTVGDVNYSYNENIRMYILKAMGRAYELGKMDQLKDALREINTNKN